VTTGCNQHYPPARSLSFFTGKTLPFTAIPSFIA